MRVAGNKLRHIKEYYVSELSSIYSLDEVEAVFALIAESVLGFSRSELQVKIENNINQSDLIKLYDQCKELKKNIPVQYVLSEAHFFGLIFKVNKYVLIPRPETEELVDLILKENKTFNSLLDIGTGSGCIPISIKKNRSTANVFACDISEDALVLAKKNAQLHAVEIDFFKANALDPFSIKKYQDQKFDIIVSNPPYINIREKDQMEKNVLEHEPHMALFVEGEDDTIFYKKIIDLCTEGLISGGKLYFELNPMTSGIVKEYALRSNQFISCELIKDMSGKMRFFRGLKK